MKTEINMKTESHNNGGPAFPNVPSDPQYQSWDEGMSLRDWFAGQAIASVSFSTMQRSSIKEIAEHSYALADAMLEARNKQ